MPSNYKTNKGLKAFKKNIKKEPCGAVCRSTKSGDFSAESNGEWSVIFVEEVEAFVNTGNTR